MSEKTGDIAQDCLEAIPKVFPMRTDWSLIQYCKQGKGESKEDGKNNLLNTFRELSGTKLEAGSALAVSDIPHLLLMALG